MNEKINIAELNLDVDALIKSAAEVKAVLDEAREAQKQLTKEGQTSSVQAVRLAADVKSLSAAYNQQLSAITKHTKAIVDQATREQLLTTVLGKEVQSIDEAREQNKLLNQIRNQTNVTTEEGRQELIALNEQLDRNNDFIKENADAYLQQKINIGNYRDDIRGALDDLNPLNGGLSSFIERSKEAGGAGNLIKSSFTAASAGIVGMTKASIAFILTPVGATITALVVIIGALIAIFKRGVTEMNKTSDGANEMNKGFARLKALIEPISKAFGALAKIIVGNVLKAFNDTYDAVMILIEGFGELMSLMGAETIGNNIKGWAKDVQNVSKENQKILDLQNEYNKKSREAKLIQLEYQRDAEKLRQIRDDESKSMDERIKANVDLGNLLKKQAQEELAIQMINLQSIDLEIKLKGNIVELEDARIAALTEIADIQERITGQESEQKTNIVSLRKEAADLAKQRQDDSNQRAEEEKQRAKEAADEATAQLNEKLRIYLAENDAFDKSQDEQIAILKNAHDQKLKILQADYDASDKKESDKLKLQASTLEAENELALQKLDIAQTIAEQILANEIQTNQSRLDANRFLSDELYNQELLRLSNTEAAEAAYLLSSYENKKITAEQFELQMTQLQIDSQTERDALALQRKEAETQQAAIDLQTKIELAKNNFIIEHELKAQQLEMQRQQELAEAEKTGADKALINAKYNELQKQNDKALNENKLNLAKSTFGNLATIFGEQSRAGKAMAIMQTTIDTYQAAVAAYGSLAAIPIVGPALGAVAAGAAVAMGLANVKKIASTKEPKFSRGGIFEVGGRLHSSGGTKFTGSDGSRFEAEKGEGIGILSRGAFGAFQSFNNMYRGGLSDPTNYMMSDQIYGVVDAIRNMPAPIVAVEEILDKSSNYVSVINYADL